MNNPFDEEDIDARNSMREHLHYSRPEEEDEEAIRRSSEQWRKKREALQEQHRREVLDIWKDIVSDDEAYR